MLERLLVGVQLVVGAVTDHVAEALVLREERDVISEEGPDVCYLTAVQLVVEAEVWILILSEARIELLGSLDLLLFFLGYSS